MFIHVCSFDIEAEEGVRKDAGNRVVRLNGMQERREKERGEDLPVETPTDSVCVTWPDDAVIIRIKKGTVLLEDLDKREDQCSITNSYIGSRAHRLLLMLLCPPFFNRSERRF